MKGKELLGLNIGILNSHNLKHTKTCNNLSMLNPHKTKNEKQISEIELIELFGSAICIISQFLPSESLCNQQIIVTGDFHLH